MPPQVHLEEPLLGVDVALRPGQVGDAVAVDVRDAALVAHHRDLGAEAGEVGLPGGLGQRVAHGGHDHDGGDERSDHHDGDQSQKDTTGDDGTTHPARLGHRRTTTRGRAVRTDLDAAARGGWCGDRVLPRRPDAGPARGQPRPRRLGGGGAALGALGAAVAAHLPRDRARARRGGLRHPLRLGAADPGARLRRARAHPRRGRAHDPVVRHPPVGRAGRGAGDGRGRGVGARRGRRRARASSAGRGRSPSSSPPCSPRPMPPPSSRCSAGCRCRAGSPGCSRPSRASTTRPSCCS